MYNTLRAVERSKYQDAAVRYGARATRLQIEDDDRALAAAAECGNCGHVGLQLTSRGGGSAYRCPECRYVEEF